MTDATAPDPAVLCLDKIKDIIGEHGTATGELISPMDRDELLAAYTPRAMLAALLQVEDAIGNGRAAKPWGLLKHILTHPGSKRKAGGATPSVPGYHVAIDERWQAMLDLCQGDRELAARTLVSTLLAPLAVRPPDSLEPTPLEHIYARCDQRAKGGTWLVEWDKLVETLRENGLDDWAGWFLHVLQSPGSKEGA